MTRTIARGQLSFVVSEKGDQGENAVGVILSPNPIALAYRKINFLNPDAEKWFEKVRSWLDYKDGDESRVGDVIDITIYDASGNRIYKGDPLHNQPEEPYGISHLDWYDIYDVGTGVVIEDETEIVVAQGHTKSFSFSGWSITPRATTPNVTIDEDASYIKMKNVSDGTLHDLENLPAGTYTLYGKVFLSGDYETPSANRVSIEDVLITDEYTGIIGTGDILLDVRWHPQTRPSPSSPMVAAHYSIGFSKFSSTSNNGFFFVDVTVSDDPEDVHADTHTERAKLDYSVSGRSSSSGGANVDWGTETDTLINLSVDDVTKTIVKTEALDFTDKKVQIGDDEFDSEMRALFPLI